MAQSVTDSLGNTGFKKEKKRGKRSTGFGSDFKRQTGSSGFNKTQQVDEEGRHIITTADGEKMVVQPDG